MSWVWVSSGGTWRYSVLVRDRYWYSMSWVLVSNGNYLKIFSFFNVGYWYLMSWVFVSSGSYLRVFSFGFTRYWCSMSLVSVSIKNYLKIFIFGSCWIQILNILIVRISINKNWVHSSSSQWKKMKINANNNQLLFNTFPETVSSQYSIKTFYSIPPLFFTHCREAVGSNLWSHDK